MNCRPGDLAYVVVPKGFSRLLAGKFVTVHEHGCDDMTPQLTPVRAAGHPEKLWFCAFHVPFHYGSRLIEGMYLLDAWLRRIGRPDDAEVDETLLWAPVPLPAVELALLDEVHK